MTFSEATADDLEALRKKESEKCMYTYINKISPFSNVFPTK
jgi:hypothetical protein